MTSRQEYPTGHVDDSPETPVPTSVGGGEPRSGEGAEPLLGNLAEFVGSASATEPFGDPFRSWQLERYQIRDRLRSVTRDDRLRHCGAHSIRALGSVDVRRSVRVVAGKPEFVVGVSGLASCGRWYTCPFCAAQIAARRRGEIEQGIAAAVAQGLVVGMLTLTVRHRKRHALADLLGALRQGWRSVGQDKAVRRFRREIGWVGYVRVLELTYGPSGWHPHIHLLVFFDPQAATVEWEDGEADPDLLRGLQESTLRSWTAGVVKAGLRAPNRRAYDLKILADPKVEVPAYMTKSILGRQLSPESVKRVSKVSHEITGAMTKQGRALPNGQVLSRTNWDIVEAASKAGPELAMIRRAVPFADPADLVEEARWAKAAQLHEDIGVDHRTGEVVTLGMVKVAATPDVRLFWEMEGALRGQAMVNWSQNLKGRFGIGEITDDDIVAEALSGPESTVIGLPRSGVNRVQANQQWHGLKQSVKTGARTGGVTFCNANGIDWLDADDPTLVVDRKYRQWQGKKGYDAAVDMRYRIEEERWLAAAGGQGSYRDEEDGAA